VARIFVKKLMKRIILYIINLITLKTLRQKHICVNNNNKIIYQDLMIIMIFYLCNIKL